MAKARKSVKAAKAAASPRGAKKVTAGTKKASAARKAGATAEAWAARAAEVPLAVRWSVPWFVLMQEAATASAFVDKRWKKGRAPGKNSAAIPGLESVAKLLPAGVAAEIRELQALAQEAHEAYLLHTRPETGGDPRPRAEHVLGEITAALEFFFDDGVEDARDAQLAAVQAAHADDGQSNAAIASALEDYASLARAHRAELDGLGGFDAAVLDEVPAIVKALRQPTSAGAAERSPEASVAIETRNRFGNLLVERINRVRSAAQFVFRAWPEIVREVTSTYTRRRRAAARRAAAGKSGAGGVKDMP